MNAPDSPSSPRPRWRRRIRAGLVAATVAASGLGLSLALNPAPAAAASNCLRPNFVKTTHWKDCSATSNVYHRFAYEEWRANGNHVWDCYLFHSTLYTPREETSFDSENCKLIY
jgi:hypothetical protein